MPRVHRVLFLIAFCAASAGCSDVGGPPPRGPVNTTKPDYSIPVAENVPWLEIHEFGFASAFDDVDDASRDEGTAEPSPPRDVYEMATGTDFNLLLPIRRCARSHLPPLIRVELRKQEPDETWSNQFSTSIVPKDVGQRRGFRAGMTVPARNYSPGDYQLLVDATHLVYSREATDFRRTLETTIRIAPK